MAERAGDHDRLGAVAPGVLDDGAAEPHDGAGAADAERAAAALDLHVPVDGVAAAGADDVVHLRGLLRVVAATELGRTNQQAAVVGGELDALEGLASLGDAAIFSLMSAACIVQQLHGIEHLDAVCERPSEDLGHPLGEALLGPRSRGARRRGGCSRRRMARARGRSPAPRRAPDCAPAAPRRAGDRSCGHCWRRSSSSPGSRRGGCRGERRRHAGSRRTPARCRATSSRDSRRRRERSSARAASSAVAAAESSVDPVLMGSPRTARRCA